MHGISHLHLTHLSKINLFKVTCLVIMCLQLFNAIVMYLNALIMPYKYEYLYWCKMFQCTVVFLNQCKKHGFVWLSVTVLHNIVCVCACAHATTCMSILVKMMCLSKKKKKPKWGKQSLFQQFGSCFQKIHAWGDIYWTLPNRLHFYFWWIPSVICFSGMLKVLRSHSSDYDDYK